jgi:hypothetical protein
MTAEEFNALCVTIAGTDQPAGDIDLATAFETHRSTIRRWRDGERTVPGPARVLARILADRAQVEAAEERRQVERTQKVRAS